MPGSAKATSHKSSGDGNAAGAEASAAFPTVGIGASAGGIEAFTALLRALRANPGFSIIFVQHPRPGRHGSLARVLGRETSLPVVLAADGVRVENNHVYIAPPETEVTVVDGTMRVKPFQTREAAPVDTLFCSLAVDCGSRAIGVVLSGTLADGALGAQAIASAGGIVFAQDDSAAFDAMPRSIGAPDYVLPPDQIARELMRIVQHAYISGGDEKLEPFSDRELQQLFAIIDQKHDLDFTHYKAATIDRRIRRRMALHRIDSVAAYLELLESSAQEVEQLYGDILIRVTSFFRDPEVFETLKAELLPQLLKEHTDNSPIRIWVPGCATGEEAYSFAIAILELTGERGFHCPVQIFGTDVSDAAIEIARAGMYPDSVAEQLSPERLRRFFTKVEGGYRVIRAVRDCCIFARQNLTKDPPFSRLDIVSCRNVMIYLGAPLQRKAMTIFHYALRLDGYLLLGSSETVGSYGEMFAVVDRRHKIYRKKSSYARAPVEFAPVAARERIGNRPMDKDQSAPSNDIIRDADRALLARYSPPAVVVNDAMEIVQFRGRTSDFLAPAPGRPTFNLLKMVREGLFADIRIAMAEARKSEQPVRRAGVHITNDAGSMIVDLEIVPFASASSERYFLVLFDDLRPDPVGGNVKARAKKTQPKKDDATTPADSRQSTRLKRELEATREYLQSIIEEQEAMNEELRSANEEIQSSNEELQSTIEEVETAKEELQSANEELTTLNEELASSNSELAEVNNDLQNLLAAVDMPIVMLSADRRIRRFSPGAQRLLNLVATDLSRVMSDVRTPVDLSQLDDVISDVMSSLELREVQVKGHDERTWTLRVRPYKTIENRIDGVVIVLITPDQLKKPKRASR